MFYSTALRGSNHGLCRYSICENSYRCSPMREIHDSEDDYGEVEAGARDVPADHIVSILFDSMEYDDMTAKEMYVFLKGTALSQKEEPISFWMRCRKFDQRRWSAGNMNDFPGGIP